MQNNESIVLIGGGSGVYQIARFLKHLRPNITTIQSVFDHGGHSGALRDERGVLPPGDIRRAILALAEDDLEPTLRKLLSYRFARKGGCSLDDVSVGNVLLTALTEIEGSMPEAIKSLSELCKVKGKILPVSLTDAELHAELMDGEIIKGEDKIDMRSLDDGRAIRKIFLEPEAELFVEAREAIINADKIVLCPGDLYTSLLPNILVKGFVESLKESKAKIIYISNIMTKKSETDGFKGDDFIKTVSDYIGGKKIDVCIANSGEVGNELLEKYKLEKASPVIFDNDSSGFAAEVIFDNLIDESGEIVRHSDKVAEIIANI